MMTGNCSIHADHGLRRIEDGFKFNTCRLALDWVSESLRERLRDILGNGPMTVDGIRGRQRYRRGFDGRVGMYMYIGIILEREVKDIGIICMIGPVDEAGERLVVFHGPEP